MPAAGYEGEHNAGHALRRTPPPDHENRPALLYLHDHDSGAHSRDRIVEYVRFLDGRVWAMAS